MVFVGPTSRDDYLKMVDILTKPKVVELSKLYDAIIQVRFTRTRLKRYGYREPEPSQLLETLRTASQALSEQDSELQFRFQHYIMKHSSVNGLVDEQTVQEMYEMNVENSRRFLDTPSSTDAKALQAMENLELRLRLKELRRFLWTTRVMDVDRRITGLRIVR